MQFYRMKTSSESFRTLFSKNKELFDRHLDTPLDRQQREIVNYTNALIAIGQY